MDFTCRTQDYWRAQVQEWKLQALAGNAIAAQNVGVALYKGELGIPRDEAEACRYFRMASRAGLSTSMFNLGWAYASGSGVPQNWAKAVSWWKRAASHGHGSAARNLGLLYALGIAPGPDGVARVDPEQAAYWYHEAAAIGNHKAMSALANCYAHGIGVPKDLNLAQVWQAKAAAAAAAAQAAASGESSEINANADASEIRPT